MCDQIVKENKIMMILHVRVHELACWEVGHMTNFQRYFKNMLGLHCLSKTNVMEESKGLRCSVSHLANQVAVHQDKQWMYANNPKLVMLQGIFIHGEGML